MDKINLTIGKDARRQLEYLKEELNLETDEELINNIFPHPKGRGIRNGGFI